MLAEIAMANAAFGVIKEAIGNGKELYDVAGVVSKFFDSKNGFNFSYVHSDVNDLTSSKYPLNCKLLNCKNYETLS